MNLPKPGSIQRRLLIIIPVVVGLILVSLFMPAQRLSIEGIGMLSFEATITLSIGYEAAYASPAFTPRTETYVNVSSLTTPFNITVTKPTGTADGDILFCWIAAYKTSTPTIDSVPSGWQQLAYNRPGNSYYYYWLYYKIASGEGASWVWSFNSTVKVRAVCSCYTAGDFDVASIDDIVVSNTAYTTSNNQCIAASMNVPNANSPLVFWAGVYYTTSSGRTFTKPSVPTTGWVEDDDTGNSTSDFWTEVCSMIWSGSGDTGDMVATISGSSSTKHAFAVALNPPSGGEPDITVNPTGYGFGAVAESSTPSTITTYFTIDNSSTMQTDQTISVTTSTWSGGDGWTHSDTATAGPNTAGLLANRGGTWGTGDIIIKYSSPNYIYENCPANTDYSFGLKLLAPTSFSDYVEKQIIVQITAVAG